MGFFRWGAPLFARWGHRVYPRWAVQELLRIKSLLPAHARVLDLGGGPGTLARLMKVRDPSSLALWIGDPEPAMLRVASSTRRVRLRAETLPFRDASMDAVLIGEALHHFDHPRESLLEVARVLRPDGHLFIFEFHPHTLLGSWIVRMERWAGEPAHFYPPEALVAMLKDVGITSSAVVRGWRFVIRGKRR